MEETIEQNPYMVCPNAKLCNHKPIWDRPIWDNRQQTGTMPSLQGHCQRHHEMDTCKESGKLCPICKPEEK